PGGPSKHALNSQNKRITIMTTENLKALPASEPATATEAIPDPFDLDSLCLKQDFAETVGVKKLLKTVPVRRPNSQDFVRTHPSEHYRLNFLCLTLKDEHETFIVRPEIAPALAGETVMKTLFTAINRQGTVFIWPVTIPPPDGKNNEWWRSE